MTIKEQPECNKRVTILLSLHSDYWNKIIRNEKKYEYRYSFPKARTRAYIYVPGKVKAIVGYIDLENPVKGDKFDIAQIFEKSGDGLYQTMLEYIGTKKFMYAVKIESFTVLNNPITYIDLKEKFPDFFAPQSYLLLDKRAELKEYIIKRD